MSDENLYKEKIQNFVPVEIPSSYINELKLLSSNKDIVLSTDQKLLLDYMLGVHSGVISDKLQRRKPG